MPIIGQSIIVEVIADPVLALYGPWVTREADAAIFVTEVLYLSTNARMTLAIEHKNVEDADSSATQVGAFSQVSAVGTLSKKVSGLKELVRFRYEPFASTTGTAWIHYRMTPPIWQPN